MMFVSGLVVFLLALTAEAQEVDPAQKWMYDLLSTSDNYEVRQYDPATWVSTNSSMFGDGDVDASIQQLMEYFNGANADGATFDMVSPLIMTMPDNSSLDSAIMWSFLLPSSFSVPPAPLDDSLFLTDATAMTVLALSSEFNNNNNMFDIGKMISDEFALQSLMNTIGEIETEAAYAVFFNPLASSQGANELWLLAPMNPFGLPSF
uniref:heme-binding protein 2-like n=1 Tax=Solea senegalensis TaxID=28829 RepID=UPI001CD8B8BA|nr:heme-binding protein 2-like [Solea senegalensis]